MGQYYNAVIKIGEEKKEVYFHNVDGEYMMAKLMEHSYWNNPFVLAIASKLWRTKSRLAWVGDYAESDDFNWNDEFEGVFAANVAKENLIYNGFRLEGKTFINHDKKMFIDLDVYENELKDKEYIINPISLLTAVGNDKGGGDFHEGKGKELIGTWAWDLVEITDKELYDYKWNADTKKYDKFLKEDFSKYEDVSKEYLFIEE